MGLIDDLDKRRGQVEETKENSARLAHAYGQVFTTGQGTIIFPDMLDFETTFIERPYVGHSSVIDVEALTDVLQLGDFPIMFPVVAGFVTEWQQDERDMYTGAWVGIRVNFPAEDLIDPTAPVQIEHHFTFSAIALKTVPVDGSDSVET